MITDILDKIESNDPDFSYIDDIIYKKFITITFCNPSFIKIYNEDKKYQKIINNIDMIFSDGMLLCKLLEYKYKIKYKRISFDGNSIAPYFLKYAKDKNLNIGLIGGKSGITEDARKILEKVYSVNIPFVNDGYFKDDEKNEIITKIKKNNIKLIIIGMGVPRQEIFANYLKNNLKNGIAITCGGYLDQIVSAQKIKYYPGNLSKFNLRFLYRVFKEPRKMLYRYIVDYFPFYLLFISIFLKLDDK